MKREATISILIGILAVLLLPQADWANDHKHAGAKPDSAITSSREVLVVKQRDALRIEGLNALYSVEYDQAQNAFEQLVSLDPEHPAGYVYQAVNIWLRCTHNTRRLHTSLYDNSELRSDILCSPPQVDENLDKQFRSLLETARAKAEARLKKDRRDTEALYFLGAAYAIQAGYEATVVGKYLAALRSSSKAVELHRKVLKLDPNFIDAYLTLGIYDYVVSKLPLAFRMMGSLFGIHGNEARGIAALERVAKEGKYCSDDARLLLVTIYQREKRYDDALAMLSELQKRYPKNCLPYLEMAALLVRINRRADAFETFDQLLAEKKNERYLGLIRFHYGDALLASGRYVEATQQFLAAAGLSGCDRQLLALAHFRAGQTYDLAKNRECAIEQYKQALDCENAFNIHARAREYLKKPFVTEVR